jgi:hypothetical protein
MLVYWAFSFSRSNRRFDVFDCIDHHDIIGETDSMSSITIRDLEPAIKERLRFRAAAHGHSMEVGQARPAGGIERVAAAFRPRSL